MSSTRTFLLLKFTFIIFVCCETGLEKVLDADTKETKCKDLLPTCTGLQHPEIQM